MSTICVEQTASHVTITWLTKLLPQGHWCIIGFLPERGKPSKTKTFTPEQHDDAVAWLAELHDDGRGCYWQPNPPKALINKKPSRDEIGMLHFAMVDVDCRNEGEPLQVQLKRALAMLTKFAPPPSAIMFSGGGYQAFWRLKEPLPATAENVAAVEEVNRWLCDKLGGDTACIDVSHAMRLPGTINFPNEQKADAGRVPKLTTMLELNANAYDLNAFGRVKKAAPMVAASTITAESVGDLTPYLQKLKDHWKDYLVTGVCPQSAIDEKTKGDKSPSGMFLSLCMALLHTGLSPAQVKGVVTSNGAFTEYLRKHGEAWLDKTLHTAEALVSRAPRIREAAPLEAAELFRAFGREHLLYYRGEWLDWDGHCYRALDEDTVNAELTRFLRTCVVSKKDGDKFKDVPYDVTPKFRNNVRAMLADTSHMPNHEDVTMPFWKPGTDEDMPPAVECVVCRNGILHLATGKLYPLTPNYVTRTAIACNWNPEARAPLFLKCLEDWFPLDVAERDKDVALLQEFLGYGLTSDKRYQKALIAVGRSRSGKGTIQRLVTRVVGRRAITTPTMSSLGDSFGLSQLTDALLAWVPDARIDHRKGNIEVSTLMLSQIGNDRQNVNRKHKDYDRNVDLPAKFIISSNELPKFTDNTGVVAQRFLPVEFNVSFSGKEDPTLDTRLAAEAEGMLVWMVEGYQRLLARGKFDPSQRTLAAVREMVAMASPFQAWLAERAVLGEQYWGETDTLYDSYETWMVGNGQGRYVKARNAFGRLLKDVTGNDKSRRGGKGEQFYGYRGIGLRSQEGVVDDVPEDVDP